jgi:hypothetical protein
MTTATRLVPGDSFEILVGVLFADGEGMDGKKHRRAVLLGGLGVSR